MTIRDFFSTLAKVCSLLSSSHCFSVYTIGDAMIINPGLSSIHHLKEALTVNTPLHALA